MSTAPLHTIATTLHCALEFHSTLIEEETEDIMPKSEKKPIGVAIDEIIAALVELDGPTGTIAVKAACEHLNINLGISARPVTEQTAMKSDATEAQITPAVSTQTVDNIRTFAEEKNPSSGVEMTCLVAYYLENSAHESERMSDVNRKDLEKYFKQAGFRLPKVIGQTLFDAKAAGYMDLSSTKGRYKLNPVGHNLVVHSLPRKKA